MTRHENRLRALMSTMPGDRQGPLVTVQHMTGDHPAWDAVWSHLAALPLNYGLADPRSALHQVEAWQLMDHTTDGAGSGVVTFRHRCHPTSRAREYVHVSWIRVVGQAIEISTRTVGKPC